MLYCFRSQFCFEMQAILPETSPFLSAQMAGLSSFFQMFIVLGMYNFEEYQYHKTGLWGHKTSLPWLLPSYSDEKHQGINNNTESKKNRMSFKVKDGNDKKVRKLIILHFLYIIKGGLISEGILALVPLPTKGAKSLPWAENLNNLALFFWQCDQSQNTL